ncbi:MAG: 2-C-methyl-D-erythritol 4-phosphate cytidylyltransferase [Pyrinomonadaceae bacterium]|nr:2-C-methyl-D-erythritol 4-phosphate cytidylyltransferase [Pyrinomonadaceae bacterium]
MNTAIIVAAGKGTRFGGEVPKQFLELAGKPVLFHTIDRFENCDAVDRIILVLPPSMSGTFKEKLPEYGLKKIAKIVSGGKTRAHSVANGLRAVDRDAVSIVGVHDGARPLVTCEDITKVFEAAHAFGAACLTAPVNDTIKLVSDGMIVKTVDRKDLRRALTPQCFEFHVLENAIKNADLSGAATDECYLVEQTGVDIAFVEGSARNIKITTPEDLKFAEMILKQEQN